MPITELNLILPQDQNPNRQEIRKFIIDVFVNEEPGNGKRDLCSKYIYNVETVASGNDIYLKRPATLNYGMDFTVHIKNVTFRSRGTKNRPSHNDIINDLILKKSANEKEYAKVKNIIKKLYNCQYVEESEYYNLNFHSGVPVEAILKAIKWLFIEQDITYWNWSGRQMLYFALKERNLC
jgi:hypothetical protein